jgi:hypothetical protein
MLTPGLTNAPTEAHSQLFTLPFQLDYLKYRCNRFIILLLDKREEFSPELHFFLEAYTAQLHYQHPLVKFCRPEKVFILEIDEPLHFCTKCWITDR